MDDMILNNLINVISVSKFLLYFTDKISGGTLSLHANNVMSRT